MPSRTPESPVLMAHGAAIEVHVFPDDDRLLRDVRRIALAVLPSTRDEHSFRTAVEEALRPWYPRMTITCRDTLATLVHEHVWYVLRDGRIRLPKQRTDRLYHAMADARDTSEHSAEAMNAARTLMDLARKPRRVHDAGLPVGGLGRPEEPE